MGRGGKQFSSTHPIFSRGLAAHRRCLKEGAGGPAPSLAGELYSGYRGGSTSVQIWTSLRPSLLSLQINQLRSRDLETPAQDPAAVRGRHGPWRRLRRSFPSCLNFWASPFRLGEHATDSHLTTAHRTVEGFENPSDHTLEDPTHSAASPSHLQTRRKSVRIGPRVLPLGVPFPWWDFSTLGKRRSTPSPRKWRVSLRGKGQSRLRPSLPPGQARPHSAPPPGLSCAQFDQNLEKLHGIRDPEQ